jgi:hypothetical protein
MGKLKKMLSFKDHLNEAKVSGEVSKLKSYITKALGSKVKITNSSRGQYHIRFAFEGDPQKFFQQHNISVSDRDGASISSKFDTFLLTLEKETQGIPAGTSIPWVNNFIGKTSSGGQLFNNKDLNPDNLGLAGQQVKASEISGIIKPILDSRYDQEVVDQLMQLVKASATKKSTVKIPNGVTFSSKDLAKVSADFGEILAAIWASYNLRFKESYFPLASNEKLIDFYGVRFGVRYPVSVKSGGGGKVTIQNIIDAIKSRAKTANADHSDEASLVVFNIVANHPMRDQMIMLHQYMETPAIKLLGQIMNVQYKGITLDSIKNWVADKDNEELDKLLTPFWKSLNMTLTDKVKFGPDKLRLIISPLGESIWKILNNSEEIKKSLNNVARQVTLIQVNVDVTKSKIDFQNNFFKEAKFEFGWAGYAAGNKLGFKMKLVK